MAYNIKVREKSIGLRKKGYSIKEIAKILHISQSTSSYWNSPIILDQKAQERLSKRKIIGQYKSMLRAKERRKALKKEYDTKVTSYLPNINLNVPLYKLLCSILFWTEGGKCNNSHVYFTNSDPKLVCLFLKTLRSSFDLDESKFRCLVHVHEYHNENEIKEFWSKITNISISQFNRSYLKPHTKKRIREDYKGCISIRYYDYRIALELRSVYNMFVESLGV